jgi:hypothetical protein
VTRVGAIAEIEADGHSDVCSRDEWSSCCECHEGSVRGVCETRCKVVVMQEYKEDGRYRLAAV